MLIRCHSPHLWTQCTQRMPRPGKRGSTRRAVADDDDDDVERQTNFRRDPSLWRRRTWERVHTCASSPRPHTSAHVIICVHVILAQRAARVLCGRVRALTNNCGCASHKVRMGGVIKRPEYVRSVIRNHRH